MEGRADWPHNVYRLYWPLASSASFTAAPPTSLAAPLTR
jgi:hypothetical protein